MAKQLPDLARKGRPSFEDFDILVDESGDIQCHRTWESSFGKKHGGKEVALVGACVAFLATMLLGAAIVGSVMPNGSHTVTPLMITFGSFVVAGFAVVHLYLRLPVALGMNGLILLSVTLGYGIPLMLL